MFNPSDDEIRKIIQNIFRTFFKKDLYKKSQDTSDFLEEIDNLIGKGYVGFSNIPFSQISYPDTNEHEAIAKYTTAPITHVLYSFNNFYVIELQSGFNKNEISIRIRDNLFTVKAISHNLKMVGKLNVTLPVSVYSKPIQILWKEKGVVKFILRKKDIHTEEQGGVNG